MPTALLQLLCLFLALSNVIATPAIAMSVSVCPSSVALINFATVIVVVTVLASTHPRAGCS